MNIRVWVGEIKLQDYLTKVLSNYNFIRPQNVVGNQYYKKEINKFNNRVDQEIDHN